MLHPSQTYDYYSNIFKGISFPYAFVDLDRFDDNVNSIALMAENKPIRIATKSIRCFTLIQRILKQKKHYQGLMTYNASETVWLSRQGFNNILIGYPVWHENEINAIIQELKNGKEIILMVDCISHIEHINTLGKKHNAVIPVCIDIDMSSNFQFIYFGVYRSSVNTIDKAIALFKEINNRKFINLKGIMGYEAQIAGLNNAVPGRFLMNTFITMLKKKSFKSVSERRIQIVENLKKMGAEIQFVNGGGTGSLEWTITDSSVTEVTAGSGFYCSGLFDHYSNFSHYPAAAFALEITRKPKEKIYTASGGGYIASGSTSDDKLPKPFLPEGIRLIKNEGAGEVQTPFMYSGKDELNIGYPVFFRHAKAGEISERFEKFYLVSNGNIVDTVNTYRGDGKCYL
jgi:D-serine deaminase-like pyridoxal phosphate-dependent protein